QFWLVFVFFFVTSLVLFPDSPIRQFGEPYVGKGGHPYTAEDYRLYQQLNGIEIVAWAGGFLSALYANAEYHQLTGSPMKPNGEGIEIWRKPKNAEMTEKWKATSETL